MDNNIKPQPLEDLSAPEHLTDDAVEIWDRLTPIYHRLGLLTEVDAPSFADLCQAQADYERLAKKVRGNEIIEGINKKGEKYMLRHPLCIERDARYKVYAELNKKFGGTPKDRKMLPNIADDTDDIVADILNGIK